MDDSAEILMALPFLSAATHHRVTSVQASWWANCAWDTLAIPAAMGIDAGIDAEWLDTGSPVELAIRNGELTSTDGFIHFATPTRRWWDYIVET